VEVAVPSPKFQVYDVALPVDVLVNVIGVFKQLLPV
jgi:hypothetical protein